jgi:hypothetical protein
MNAATAMSAALVVGAGLVGGCTTSDEASPLDPAPAGTPQHDSDDTMLATAFPITSVLRAAEASLPRDAAVAEVPMDVRWQPGNRIDVPIERGGQAGIMTVTVARTCVASSALLDPTETEAVAAAVCATWEAEGRLPVVVPDPDAPPEMNPEDAAR